MQQIYNKTYFKGDYNGQMVWISQSLRHYFGHCSNGTKYPSLFPFPADSSGIGLRQMIIDDKMIMINEMSA